MYDVQPQYDVKNDCGEVLFTKEQVQAATHELGRKVSDAWQLFVLGTDWGVLT